MDISINLTNRTGAQNHNTQLLKHNANLMVPVNIGNNVCGSTVFETKCY